MTEPRNALSGRVGRGSPRPPPIRSTRRARTGGDADEAAWGSNWVDVRIGAIYALERTARATRPQITRP
jgi:hypothetical protein